MSYKVPNYDEIVSGKKRVKIEKRSFFAPQQPTRMAICAPTGKGKSNLMLHFLFGEGMMRISQLYYICGVPTEDKAIWMKKMMKPVQEAVNELPEPYQVYTCLTKLSDVPDIGTLNPDHDPTFQVVVVINDLLYEKQADLCKFFANSRHGWCSIIYLAQKFIDILPQIRNNLSDVILFKPGSWKDVQYMRKDVQGHLTDDEFLAAYKEATKSTSDSKFNFLWCSPHEEHPAMRFRKNINGVYSLPFDN